MVNCKMLTKNTPKRKYDGLLFGGGGTGTGISLGADNFTGDSGLVYQIDVGSYSFSLNVPGVCPSPSTVGLGLSIPQHKI
jgi:hypothetical protein